MHETVSGLLDIPVVRETCPEVLGGACFLDRRVRWLHTTDGTDFAGLLKGGELILTAGSAFTGSAGNARAYFDELVRNGASGVMISPLSDRSEVISVLREASRNARLPVILLKDRVPFVDLTEAVHRMLLSEDRGERAQDRAAFELVERLSVESANPTAVLRKTAEILLAPVVYEDLHHRVVMFASANVPVARLLSGWIEKSRRVSSAGRSGEWPQVTYREHGEPGGRLLVPERLAGPHTEAVLGRAVQLLERCFEGPSSRTGVRVRSLVQLFADLRNAHADEESALVRAEASGFGGAQKYLPTAFLRLEAPAGRLLEPYEAMRLFLDDLYETAHEVGVELTAGGIGELAVGALLRAPAGAERQEALHALSAGLLRRASEGSRAPSGWSMAVGSEYGSLREAAASGVEEAFAIARAARGLNVENEGYYTAGDVRLRRLLSSLAGDRRIEAFTAESITALRQEDPQLLHTLRKYIELNGNVTELARVMYLSRPSVYARIRRIEQLIGGSLNRVDTRVGLYIALLVDSIGENGPAL